MQCKHRALCCLGILCITRDSSLAKNMDSPVAAPRRLASLDTELTADVVAFCPYDSRYHLLVCGCYQLVKGPELTAEVQCKSNVCCDCCCILQPSPPPTYVLEKG